MLLHLYEALFARVLFQKVATCVSFNAAMNNYHAICICHCALLGEVLVDKKQFSGDINLHIDGYIVT